MTIWKASVLAIVSISELSTSVALGQLETEAVQSATNVANLELIKTEWWADWGSRVFNEANPARAKKNLKPIPEPIATKFFRNHLATLRARVLCSEQIRPSAFYGNKIGEFNARIREIVNTDDRRFRRSEYDKKPGRNFAIFVADVGLPEIGWHQEFECKTLVVFPDRFEPRLMHIRPIIDRIVLRPVPAFGFSEEVKRHSAWIQFNYGDLFFTHGASFRFGFPEHLDACKPTPIQVRHRITDRNPAFLLNCHYAAITNFDGQIELAGLEAGSKIIFRMFHPDIQFGFEATKVNDEKLDATGSFELTLSEGINDLGIIDVTNSAKDFLDSVLGSHK